MAFWFLLTMSKHFVAQFTGRALAELESQAREKEDAAVRLEVRIQDKEKGLKAMESTNQVLGNYLHQLEAILVRACRRMCG